MPNPVLITTVSHTSRCQFNIVTTHNLQPHHHSIAEWTPYDRNTINLAKTTLP
ncbi:hypothetical protein N658DRAFT_119407 [Parathielavia hyrcaniae]|uniref:Uncharacterized protein n=1 Tax=Parathielavia hyrcaniae TaxID=113614 RepID=A0AAN6T665_9PEZI|nr:hypothetical protein N658DRAFT_119407 [Parathielavia hyrcaniae]